MQYECPVCESASRQFNKYYRKCVACDLIFAPDRKTDPNLFTEAYLGHVSEAAMTAFADRMIRAPSLHHLSEPKAALTISAHQEALEILNTRLSPGSHVLDIGCSTGVFLRALRKAGFKPLGCDIAKAPVDFLKAQHYDVYAGSIDEYPPQWPEPEAVTSFFVIHHLENPVEFLNKIRAKFPRSLIIISEYYDKGVGFRSPQTKPPRTLTVWNPKSLHQLLIKVGYKKIISRQTKALPSELTIPLARKTYGTLHRLIPTFAVELYFTARRVLFWPYAFWLRLLGHSYAVLAVAEPD